MFNLDFSASGLPCRLVNRLNFFAQIINYSFKNLVQIQINFGLIIAFSLKVC